MTSEAKDRHENEFYLTTLTFGESDSETTKTLNAYRLPGQEPRTLVDANEQLVKVTNSTTFAGYTHKYFENLQRIAVEHQITSDGGRLMGIACEVIIGNPKFPETCYRYRVDKAWYHPRKKELTLRIWENVEHEKQTGSSIKILKKELTQSQVIAMEHPGMQIGGRTGRTIVHQRAPTDMTFFVPEKMPTIKIKAEDPIWVVTKSC